MSCSHIDLDRKLDELLAQRPVSAPPDFAARTIQRMRQEQNPDARLDALLASFPVEAPANFASVTLWRLQRNNVLAWATSLAASIAIALSVSSIIKTPTGTHEAIVAQPPAQSTVPQAAAGVSEAAFTEPSLGELLELADGLEGAVPLLDPKLVEALDSPSSATDE